jgi:beta-1,4-mannooligosaccharide/beta-1,4-mannosyl-N-acetylglucosamine phosphorylase
MPKTLVSEGSLPNIPWQPRPAGSDDVVWRFDQNPVIPRHASRTADSIYNSAVVPFRGGFAGVFRCDDRARNMTLRVGKSRDGISFEIADERLKFECDDPEVGQFLEGYDPRVVPLDGRYYVIWCNNYHGYTIGLGYTEDFERFHQLENAFLPFNRNGVLFPRKVNGEYLMLTRPSDAGHTPFGDIFLSRSQDLVYWGKHRHVMGPRREGGLVNWQMTKIGAGPYPIETREGWLLFYHGVLTTCNGFTYSMGAALLDLDQPWHVRYRTKPYLLSPEAAYECVGNTQNVLFPCAALTDAETGRIAIYYGAADTCTGLAFCQVDELLEFVRKNSEV